MRTFCTTKESHSQERIYPSGARSNKGTSELIYHTHPILHLQRIVGNHAVQRLLRTNAKDFKALRSSGQRPELATGSSIESRFAPDFSMARVHADERVGNTEQALDALAFTLRHSPVFGADSTVPARSRGARLTDHEPVRFIYQSRAGLLRQVNIGDPDRAGMEQQWGVAAARSICPSMTSGSTILRQTRQRHPQDRIDDRGDVRGYSPHWPYVFRRAVSAIPDIGAYVAVFSPRDLLRGALRTVAQATIAGVPHRWEVSLTSFSARPESRGRPPHAQAHHAVPERGVMVHRIDVRINRWVNVNDVFGELTVPRVNSLNRDPQQLQQRLDDSLAETMVHEFTHVHISVARDAPPAMHTPTFTQYQAFMVATNSPGSRAAYQQVERVASAIIRYIAQWNRIDALAARVIPLHFMNMQEWFVNELFTNVSTMQRFGHTPSASDIARWYADGRIKMMRRDLGEAAAGQPSPRTSRAPRRASPRQSVRLPSETDPVSSGPNVGWQTLEEEFRNAVTAFYRQILRAYSPAAVPPRPAAVRH